MFPDDSGELVQATFASIEAAQAALDEFFIDIPNETDAGQRDVEQGYDCGEFRIIEVETD